MFAFFVISLIIADEKMLKIHIDRPIINMIMYTHWSSLGTLRASKRRRLCGRDWNSIPLF